MICKKTRDKINERGKQEEKYCKDYKQLKEEALCALEEKLCPYCATETKCLGRLRDVFHWEYILEKVYCSKCNKVFTCKSGQSSRWDFEIKDGEDKK